MLNKVWPPAMAVATREGGVDRNIMAETINLPRDVATREGGVDRNIMAETVNLPRDVATREGGVDRNAKLPQFWALEVGRHPRGWRG